MVDRPANQSQQRLMMLEKNVAHGCSWSLKARWRNLGFSLDPVNLQHRGVQPPRLCSKLCTGSMHFKFSPWKLHPYPQILPSLSSDSVPTSRCLVSSSRKSMRWQQQAGKLHDCLKSRPRQSPWLLIADQLKSQCPSDHLMWLLELRTKRLKGAKAVQVCHTAVISSFFLCREERDCTMPTCPVDCAFNDWADWLDP